LSHFLVLGLERKNLLNFLWTVLTVSTRRLLQVFFITGVYLGQFKNGWAFEPPFRKSLKNGIFSQRININSKHEIKRKPGTCNRFQLAILLQQKINSKIMS
jgi:hypothetical protein